MHVDTHRRLKHLVAHHFWDKDDIMADFMFIKPGRLHVNKLKRDQYQLNVDETNNVLRSDTVELIMANGYVLNLERVFRRRIMTMALYKAMMKEKNRCAIDKHIMTYRMSVAVRTVTGEHIPPNIPDEVDALAEGLPVTNAGFETERVSKANAFFRGLAALPDHPLAETIDSDTPPDYNIIPYVRHIPQMHHRRDPLFQPYFSQYKETVSGETRLFLFDNGYALRIRKRFKHAITQAHYDRYKSMIRRTVTPSNIDLFTECEDSFRDLVESFDFYPLLLIDPENKEPKKGLWPFVLPKTERDDDAINHITNAYLAARIPVPYTPAAEYLSESDHRKVNALLLCLSQLPAHEQAMPEKLYGILKTEYWRDHAEPPHRKQADDQLTLFRGNGRQERSFWNAEEKPAKPQPPFVLECVLA